jgi:hypothetical protein
VNNPKISVPGIQIASIAKPAYKPIPKYIAFSPSSSDSAVSVKEIKKTSRKMPNITRLKPIKRIFIIIKLGEILLYYLKKIIWDIRIIIV